VVGKTEDNITLDSNNALANETLRFRVTLLNVTPVSQR
jgi:FKBP-type peptidyl-prolyl cis-trans isomerase 2